LISFILRVFLFFIVCVNLDNPQCMPFALLSCTTDLFVLCVVTNLFWTK